MCFVKVYKNSLDTHTNELVYALQNSGFTLQNPSNFTVSLPSPKELLTM